ncbi:MAG: hypothetical protein J3R72DRAFT_464269 [Linnemannia gamsii]|nr:MAG: hypothetical protein J3R72DRAFT_464269 [Linnemannia gamsii]
MHSINTHQTSGHAVLIIHLHSIDPTSVTQQISHSHDSAEIRFKHKNNTYTTSDSTAPTTLATTTTVLVQPVLHVQEQEQRQERQQEQPLTKDLIQECSFSVSSENIVIQLKKATPCEWQALQLHFKSLSSRSNAVSVPSSSPSAEVAIEQEVGAQQGSEGQTMKESSVLVKFVTVSNTISFQEAIQSQPLWDQATSSSRSGYHQVVGNVQAKRVPGMNAIQMTAELVSSSSSS